MAVFFFAQEVHVKLKNLQYTRYMLTFYAPCFSQIFSLNSLIKKEKKKRYVFGETFENYDFFLTYGPVTSEHSKVFLAYGFAGKLFDFRKNAISSHCSIMSTGSTAAILALSGFNGTCCPVLKHRHGVSVTSGVLIWRICAQDKFRCLHVCS